MNTKAANDYPQDDPILRMRDVEKSVGLKKPTIYKLIKQSQFPSPINLGGRASGWLLSEINQWKAERIAVDWHPNRSTHLRRIGST
jgi:prophage regulatory protein